MEKEKEQILNQEKPNYKFIEYFLDNAYGDLPKEQLDPLIKDIDDPKSYKLLVRYLKRDMELRLPLVINILNFKFSTDPKTWEECTNLKDQIAELLEEKDGIIDASKREQAQDLLKQIRDAKVPE